jgi:hypothetical protein
MTIDNRAVSIAARCFASRQTPRLALTAAALVAMTCAAPAQTVLPTDAKPTCTVPSTLFDSWFTSGTPTANGSVEPADSLTFSGSTLCNFYRWSDQMFLWLTSPAPARYHSNALVLNSPVFYDVSPLDNGQRTLIQVSPGLRVFGPVISQLGPKGLPVIFDSTGKMFTVVRPEAGPSGLPIVRTPTGQQVEVARTEIANGRPPFLDKTGKAIDVQTAASGAPRLFDQTNRAIDLVPNKTVVANGRTFFLDSAGDAVDTEQGQAGGGNVLMTINGKLVYYALSVNDVYGYFLTGQKDGAISATGFPTTAPALSAIEAFALAHSTTFPDPNALTVEVKSAWIETAGLADVNKYITITATIPTYNTSNPTHWVNTGTKQAQLALVGIHVVGSAQGHPEMLWATFEHVNNSRNAAYNYTNTANATINVAQNNGGTWLFSKTPATATPNVPLNVVSGADIVAVSPPTPIGPSDVLRIDAWGTASSNVAFTANNTDIISINNSVLGQLVGSDVRKNYILTGTTWTFNGLPPAPGPGVQVGTNEMANSAAETFFQPSNCFNCHDGSNMLGGPTGDSGLSHIWGPIKPLFP